MHDLPADWGALCALVFLLGMRHGFDADHLAAIDGLTRLNQARQPAVARWCGALFSLGHGAVVLAVAAGVGLLSEQRLSGTALAPLALPAWFGALGAWVSIAFLLGLGLANLRAVLATAPGEVVALQGWRSLWMGRWLRASHPLAVAGVGTLFALSFDTLSQALLFAATAVRFGGLPHALLLGLLFTAGMLATDALNGWWIARLIARADQIAALASRLMGTAVAGVSLVIGALGLARLLSPALDAWVDHQGLAQGATVVATLALAYLGARLLARRNPDQARATAGPNTA